MTITIHSPCIITGRLLPGVKIGDTTLSIEYADRNRDGRQGYYVYIDGPNITFLIDDIRSGCQGGSLQEGLASALSFLGYAADQYKQTDDNMIFPPNVCEWAYQNENDLSMLACELEETADLIQE